jgi:N-acetylglucosamine kinase-like BadF-type ATPase
MKVFVGVDGGGTATKAVVLSDTLEVLGRGEAGPSNHYRMGPPQAAENCVRAAEAAFSAALRLSPGLERDSIAAWGFGLAGVRRESDSRLMRAQLQPVAGEGPWALDTDAVAAHWGAFNGGPGVVLSAGTGAIALGLDEGEKFYSDGWGPLLGDEGSGYWIGLESLRTVCRAHDGRAPRTTLAQTILHELHLSEAHQLVPMLQGGKLEREKIAELARVVLTSAEAGIGAAVEIREQAIAHLALSVAAVTHSMLSRRRDRVAPASAESMDLAIALRGGLFDDDFFRASTGYAIGEHMVEMKRDFLPLASWNVLRPQFDAAYGAALMAKHAAENDLRG